MAINKAKKTDILSKLKDVLHDATSVVFVNFHGMSVGDTTEMRKKLRAEGVRMFVAKKTLIRKVLTDTKVSGDIPSLDGEVALAYGNDMLAPAREVFAFQKRKDGKVAILGGIFDGVLTNKEAMLDIATIPPLQTLRAQFVNIINSPIQGLVMSLNQIAEKKN